MRFLDWFDNSLACNHHRFRLVVTRTATMTRQAVYLPPEGAHWHYDRLPGVRLLRWVLRLPCCGCATEHLTYLPLRRSEPSGEICQV